MVYMVPIHHGWLWFPNNPGLVSGLILGGYGTGALIYDNVFTHLINPDNLPIDDDGFYPPEVDDRFVMTWLTLVTTWIAIFAVGFIMINPGPVKKTAKKEI